MNDVRTVGIASGGLDSICYIVNQSPPIVALSFNYGQKGLKEVKIAKEILAPYVKEHKILDISFMKDLWPKTQLTDDAVKVENAYQPNVVVPLRNAIFLTIGTAYGLSVGAGQICYGAHLDDTGGYPDCTPEFIEAFQTAMHLGHFRDDRKIEIWSPSREGISKVTNLQLGYKILGDKVFETWSCYKHEDKQCGVCESCVNRKNAFIAAKIEDKTKYSI